MHKTQRLKVLNGTFQLKAEPSEPIGHRAKRLLNRLEDNKLFLCLFAIIMVIPAILFALHTGIIGLYLLILVTMGFKAANETIKYILIIHAALFLLFATVMALIFLPLNIYYEPHYFLSIFYL